MLRRKINLAQPIIFLMMLVFSVVSYAAASDNAVPVYTTDKKTIIVSADQPQFTIKLASNPTTGYSWFLHEHDPQLLTSVKHAYESPTSQSMGAGGFEYWTFQVTPEALAVPHDFTIRFNYARPWETGLSGTQTVFHIYTK